MYALLLCVAIIFNYTTIHGNYHYPLWLRTMDVLVISCNLLNMATSISLFLVTHYCIKYCKYCKYCKYNTAIPILQSQLPQFTMPIRSSCIVSRETNVLKINLFISTIFFPQFTDICYCSCVVFWHLIQLWCTYPTYPDQYFIQTSPHWTNKQQSLFLCLSCLCRLFISLRLVIVNSEINIWIKSTIYIASMSAKNLWKKCLHVQSKCSK